MNYFQQTNKALQLLLQSHCENWRYREHNLYFQENIFDGEVAEVYVQSQQRVDGTKKTRKGLKI